jgi:hypothetical protein
MGRAQLRILATSLVLVGGAGLTSAATAGPAESAASAPPVPVSISATRVVTMPTTIQPGVNTFRVTTATRRGSAFQLVQPAPGYTAEEASRDIEKGLEHGKIRALKRFEANITLLGGMLVTKQRVGILAVHLDPGTYWALDTNTNDPAKFFAFTAAGVDTGNVMPDAGATLKARLDTTWANKPASIPNKGLLRFKNAATQNHFIALVRLNKGKTYRDFVTWFTSENPSGPPPVNFDVGMDSGALSPGHSATFRYNLPKGHYVLLCFWPDAEMGGIPHAFMGMHRPITLK